MATKQLKATTVEPTEMALFSEAPQIDGSGRGSEGVSTSDLVIPRLEIVQDLSPQRKKTDPAYIPGAEEGMMFNTVTKELYPTGVIIVPVLFRKEFIIWKNRQKGGGFAGSFETVEAALHALSEMENRGDYEIQDTHQNFCLVLHPESTAEDPIVGEIVLSFSKTKMKIGRQLNSMIKMRGGDRWSSAYRLEVVQATSDKGDYFNYKVTPIGYVSPATAALAERMYEEVKSFRKDISREAVAEGAEETTY